MSEQIEKLGGLGQRRGKLSRLFFDIFSFTSEEKKWWLLPFIFVVLALAGLLVFVMMSGALAPFIYPLL